MSSDDRFEETLKKPGTPVPTAGAMADKHPVIVPSKTLVTVKSTKSMKVTSLGLEVQARVDEPEWLEFGNQLFATETSIAWVFGDWINAGDFEWGAYKKFAQEHERNWLTITDYAYICRNVHLSCRHDKLSLSHHKVVAPLYDTSNKEGSRNLQRALLQYAAENNLNKHEFREAVRQVTEGTPDEVTPALPDNVVESKAIPIVIKQPFWHRPLERLEKDFIRRWKDAAQDERQAALKRLKALVRELERME